MTHLRRVMTSRDVTLFFIVAVVSPRWIASAAAAGPSAVVVWLVACLTFFLPLAWAVVALSSRFPGEGGLYVWIGRAFGPFAGFLSAWMYWVSNVIYLPGLLYFAAGNLLFAGDASWRSHANDPRYYLAVAMAGIAIGVGMNLFGLSLGKRLHNLGALFTWLPAALLIPLGVIAWMRFGAATSFAPALPSGGIRLSDVFFWSTIAFAFGGLESASLMGDEIVDAERSVPKAVLASGVAIVAIYVLGTLAILVAIPASEVSGLQGIMQATERMADRVGAHFLVPVAAILIGLGALAGASAWLAATARLPYVAGVDRYLPASFGRVHPRWGTPVVALLLQAVGAALVAVLGQAGSSVRSAYDVLVGMGVITYFIPFLLMFAAAIRLEREPAPAGAIRLPGGRALATLAALLGFATTLVSAVLAAFPPGDGHPWVAAAKVIGGSAFLMGVGALLYLRGRRGRTSEALPLG